MQQRGDGDFFFLHGEMNQLPRGTVLQEPRDQCRVHGVAGSLGNHVALDAFACQRQVADQIEDFVADKFIGKTEGPVLHALTGQDDCVFWRGAANQSHVAKLFFILAKAEGAGGGELSGVGSGIQIQLKRFFADGRGKVDGVGNAVAIAGIDADKFAGIVDLNGFADAEIFSPATLGLQPDRLEGGDVRQRAAIEDGQLQVVELDDDVIDAVADQRGEQMLGGGNQNSLAHEAGRVTDLSYVAAGCGNFKIVEIGAAE